MARAGINKAVVNTARLALIARGEHPSIDAVRIEMGNTGSKTTIHRYLKELEARQPLQSMQPVTLSNELTELVGRLAERLVEEGRIEVDAAQEQFDQQLDGMRESQAASEHTCSALQQQCEVQQQALTDQAALLAACQSSLQAEQTRNARLSQAHDDLQLRLADRDQHIASLEEKHQHARDALEHYRQSVKEQRDQDARRHETQLQGLEVQVRHLQQDIAVKQEEGTLLNRDNERLLAQLNQAQASERRLIETGERLQQDALAVHLQLAKVEGARDELLRQTGQLHASLDAATQAAQRQSRLLEQVSIERDRLSIENIALQAPPPSGPVME